MLVEQSHLQVVTVMFQLNVQLQGKHIFSMTVVHLTIQANTLTFTKFGVLQQLLTHH